MITNYCLTNNTLPQYIHYHLYSFSLRVVVSTPWKVCQHVAVENNLWDNVQSLCSPVGQWCFSSDSLYKYVLCNDYQYLQILIIIIEQIASAPWYQRCTNSITQTAAGLLVQGCVGGSTLSQTVSIHIVDVSEPSVL